MAGGHRPNTHPHPQQQHVPLSHPSCCISGSIHHKGAQAWHHARPLLSATLLPLVSDQPLPNQTPQKIQEEEGDHGLVLAFPTQEHINGGTPKEMYLGLHKKCTYHQPIYRRPHQDGR